MDYRKVLSEIMRPTQLGSADFTAKYVQMVKRGERMFAQILQQVQPQQRAAVATKIIKMTLDKATTGDYRWRIRPKWAPMREEIMAEGMTLDQQISGVAAYIAAGLSGLRLGTEEVRKVLKGMIERLKGNMEWAMNTPAWQQQNMGGAVKGYVERAIAQGKGILRFNTRGLNQTSQQNMLQYYNQALRDHGLAGKWHHQQDGSMVLDFRGAAEIKRLVDKEAPLAQQAGPDPNGRLVLHVGTVANRLVAKGLIDNKTAQFVFQAQLRKHGLDPTRMHLTADEPGTRQGAATAAASRPVASRPVASRLAASRPAARRNNARLAPQSNHIAPRQHARSGGGARVDANGNPTHDIYGQPIDQSVNWDVPLDADTHVKPTAKPWYRRFF